MGHDFGFNHANAVLKVGIKDGELYVFKESYLFEKDTGEIIEELNAEGWDKKQLMYCDSAEPDRIRMLRKEGFNAHAVVKGAGSVKDQINWLKQRKIHIHPSCQNLYKEMSQWKWKKDSKTNTYLDVPVDFFDDAIAALRYATESWRIQELKFIKRREGRKLLY